MGISDKISKVVSDNEDKIDGAIDKVADIADSKTKGKYSDKIDGAADKAKGIVDKLGD